ncbi:transposase InsO family protein [Enterococcus sp. UD-01]
MENYIQYYNHERMKRKLNNQSPVVFREAAQR